MIALVIRNSSSYCISMVCDRFGKSRSGRPKVNADNSELPVPRIRPRRSKKCGCTFELYGVRTRVEESSELL